MKCWKGIALVVFVFSMVVGATSIARADSICQPPELLECPGGLLYVEYLDAQVRNQIVDGSLIASLPGGADPGSAIGFGEELDGFDDLMCYTHLFNPIPPATCIDEALLRIGFRGEDDCFAFLNTATIWIDPANLFDFHIRFANDEQSFDVDGSQLADGSLNVKVWHLTGDFYVDYSQLEVCYCPEGEQNPVPEPSTMLLLGAGIVGTIIRKRMSARA